MVSVPNAEAYERVMALVHDGRITAMDGEAFVVVGDFADARQGHALGLALQRRLRLPFELVYDPLHPQANLALRPSAGSSQPIRRSSLPAVPAGLAPAVVADPVVPESLIYLYADPRDQSQKQLLAQFLKLPLHDSDPEGVRVGVYRDTARGVRLMRRQEVALQAIGIPLQRYRRTPGSGLAIALIP